MSQPLFVSPRVLAERAQRARRISQTFGRVYLGTKATQWIEGHLRPPDMERRWSRLHHDNARAVYHTAVDLRGLILKGCQFLGARADVLPSEWVEHLSKLQDRVPAHPFPVVRRSVERELRAPLDSVFSSFSEHPIASASLAQVHEATLRNGRRVAVKVQYPEIAKLVHGDLANLRFLFRALGYLERDFDPMPLVEELSNTMPLELDFENEGRNSEIVAGHFAHRSDIAVPEIVWDLTTRRVLVMEFQSGIKIDDAEGLRAAGVDPAEVGRLLVEAFCEQILVHGFFHADPHPGNLLVDPEGPRLVMLDFGLTKDLPDRFREGILGFVASLVQGDVDAMGRALCDLGFEMREGGESALREVASVILKVGQEVREHGRLDPESVARLRDEIPATLRRNSLVRVPHHLVLLGRAIGLLSGVTTALGARIDWIQTVLPYAFASRR